MIELLKELLMNDCILEVLVPTIGISFCIWLGNRKEINESRYRFRRLTQKEIDEEYEKYKDDEEYQKCKDDEEFVVLTKKEFKDILSSGFKREKVW